MKEIKKILTSTLAAVTALSMMAGCNTNTAKFLSVFHPKPACFLKHGVQQYSLIIQHCGSIFLQSGRIL